jgi:hypothetical protein
MPFLMSPAALVLNPVYGHWDVATFHTTDLVGVKELRQGATTKHHPINPYHIKRSVAYILGLSYGYEQLHIKDGPLYLPRF